MLELLNQLDGFDERGDVKVSWVGDSGAVEYCRVEEKRIEEKRQ